MKQVLRNHIVMLVLILMHWKHAVLGKGIPMCFYRCQYIKLSMTPLLYYHPYWGDMTNHKQ